VFAPFLPLIVIPDLIVTMAGNVKGFLNLGVTGQ